MKIACCVHGESKRPRVSSWNTVFARTRLFLFSLVYPLAKAGSARSLLSAAMGWEAWNVFSCLRSVKMCHVTHFVPARLASIFPVCHVISSRFSTLGIVSMPWKTEGVLLLKQARTSTHLMKACRKTPQSPSYARFQSTSCALPTKIFTG